MQITHNKNNKILKNGKGAEYEAALVRACEENAETHEPWQRNRQSPRGDEGGFGDLGRRQGEDRALQGKKGAERCQGKGKGQKLM